MHLSMHWHHFIHIGWLFRACLPNECRNFLWVSQPGKITHNYHVSCFTEASYYLFILSPMGQSYFGDSKNVFICSRHTVNLQHWVNTGQYLVFTIQPLHSSDEHNSGRSEYLGIKTTPLYQFIHHCFDPTWDEQFRKNIHLVSISAWVYAILF